MRLLTFTKLKEYAYCYSVIGKGVEIGWITWEDREPKFHPTYTELYLGVEALRELANRLEKLATEYKGD